MSNKQARRRTKRRRTVFCSRQSSRSKGLERSVRRQRRQWRCKRRKDYEEADENSGAEEVEEYGVLLLLCRHVSAPSHV